MGAMMGQPKSAASLSSGLLARKGQARPAMRPQGFSGFGNLAEAMDDLGWNDMGHGDDDSLSAAEAVAADVAENPIQPSVLPIPPVLREREALKGEIESPAPVPAEDQAPPPPATEAPKPVKAPEPMSPEALVRIGRTVRAKRPTSAKAAFTLRLDGDRHLRLRLASAVCNRSAQALVTEALDAFLTSLPEVEELALAIPARGGKKMGNKD